MKNKFFLTTALLAMALNAMAIDHPGATAPTAGEGRFTLIRDGVPTPILCDADEDRGVLRAIESLQRDFAMVCGTQAPVRNDAPPARCIIIGSRESQWAQKLLSKGAMDDRELRGKREKYVMTTLKRPLPGIEEALAIVGSDKRGTIYGIYELSEQMGVSPWWDWADVPVKKHQTLSLANGTYTAGEPAVRYRGIFLNDEAPCLTSWVRNTYGTNYGDHRFYERVFELLLRLRANFLWPAMWGWAFYADDPMNSALANEMGIVVGTSHHEPMARNHQEWARHRREYGAWNYETNQKTIDDFFRKGVRRARNTEDIITIGMRGDGDTAMGVAEGHEEERPNERRNMELLTNIIRNQRNIIRQETGRPAKERPQVWALYKEVQRYYDLGLRVPDDVTILLSDDNWGDVRHLPNAEERRRSGGWGMYYHVDYVGAPRNSKWLNVTPIQNLWEQMTLTYQYGVDRLWVLNVGDLKPMEYPISLFLAMAWNPGRFTAQNLTDHTTEWCRQQFGEDYAGETARMLNLYSKYNGRITPEMLDARTYDLTSGEWQQVVADYRSLEADALRLQQQLPQQSLDAYGQLILFPIQAMANLYEMYYAQAMNQYCLERHDRQTNLWAERVAQCFQRDSLLCAQYNHSLSGGKWNGMMTQKHIGYTGWNDDFPADRMPHVGRLAHGEEVQGGCVFDLPRTACLSIEAEHYYSATAPQGTSWTIIPDMGRTLSAISLQPYSAPIQGATISYCMQLPEGVNEVKVHVVTKSTLAFQRKEGHRYQVGFAGGEQKVVNYNGNMNEEDGNIHTNYYPVVARRVVEKTVTLPVSRQADGRCLLQLSPLDPAVVFEKLVIDWGGYRRQYLFGREGNWRREGI